MATLIITFVLFCSNICSLVKYSVDSFSSSSAPLFQPPSSPRDSHFSGRPDATSLPRHETFLNRATPVKQSAVPSLACDPKVELVETKWSKRNAPIDKATETTPLIDPHV